MKFLTYSGNNLINAHLPDQSSILYAPPPMAGLPRAQIPDELERAVNNPMGMPSLEKMVNSKSRVLIAFDDNCQPFPPMRRPDIRQVVIERLLELLYSYGVEEKNIQLRCAVALHRKMKKYELAYMLGKRIMAAFYPLQLKNFDAEDQDALIELGETDHGEIVEVSREVVDCDLVIYVDSVQIPLNGGHKSVSVGFGSYRTIAHHHSPHMTVDSPNVMQPENSCMHDSIERISKVVLEHARIMVIEAAMNGQSYPAHVRYLSKPAERCNLLEKTLRKTGPLSMQLLPEPARFKIFSSIKSAYEPMAINAGAIDAVHGETLALLRQQLEVKVDRQFDTLVFGLPDLSPYSVGTRINPVLVVSDVLGYIFNWFYRKPFIKKNGVVIILNPALEFFHHEYHVAYKRFYDEVLPVTTDPFEMQEQFQEVFATDSDLLEAYRHRFAHHGFHPFTVWYWATYPLRYLSDVILVGPSDDRVASRLGVSWSPTLSHALGRSRELTGGDDVVALSVPPFAYLTVDD